MTTSKNLAGLVGPTAMVLTASEALNFHIWKVGQPQLTYLNGLILFVAGLAIVRAHNRWSLSWPVLVTAVGWVLLLAGTYRMLAPEARQAPASWPTFAGLVAGFVAGGFLTFRAFERGSSAASGGEKTS